VIRVVRWGGIYLVSNEASNMAFRAQLAIPAQRQLYDYWLQRSAGRAMPSRADLSPADFPSLLASISLMDVDMGSSRLRVRLAGTRLRDIYDREITGLHLDDFDLGDKHDYWMAAYRRVIETGRPAQGVVRGPRVNKDHLVQFWLRLPLGQTESGVNMILCHDDFVSAVDVPDHLADPAPVNFRMAAAGE
jgi:integrase